MNESDWDECTESSSSIKITPDRLKARALMKIADGRIAYLEFQEINEKNANYIFEGLYTSINEIIHAIALLEGYKIINHLCLGFFLRDFLKNDALFRLFDNCRYKRNSLVYYGKDMDLQTALQTIQNAKRLIKELRNFLNCKLPKED